MRGGVEVFPPALVEVEYREPVLPVDPLHDMQALQMAIAMHQTSEARARALRDGTSMEEAQRKIAEEVADERARMAQTPAPEVGQPSQTPAPVEDEEDGDEEVEA
jgi:hypothetical protein